MFGGLASIAVVMLTLSAPMIPRVLARGGRLPGPKAAWAPHAVQHCLNPEAAAALPDCTAQVQQLLAAAVGSVNGTTGPVNPSVDCGGAFALVPENVCYCAMW